MRLRHFIIVLFCLPIAAQAQVPGFLGKRMILEYSFQVNPYSNDFVQEGQFPTHHAINLEYVLDRKRQLGVLATFSQPDLDKVERFEDLKDVAFRGYGIQYSSYRLNSGALAPYGSYFDGSIKWLQATANSQEQESELSANRLFLGVGIGQRLVLWRRFTFNTGTHIGFSAAFDESSATATLHRALRKTYAIEMSVGLGVLLF